MLETSIIINALILSTLAGMATVAGGLAVVLFGRPSQNLLALSLGFSAGVLILVSFVELLGQAILEAGFNQAMVTFFIGIATLFLIDVALPHDYIQEQADEKRRFKRLGLLTTLGIAIHNLPEGLVVFAGALTSPSLGIVLAITIALHNIPEGMAVALPTYRGGSKKRALLYAFLAGIAEPIGALIGALLISPLTVMATLPYLLAFVAGIMVFISLDELIPTAHHYGHEHFVILGIVSGMAVVSLGMALLGVTLAG